MAKFQREKVLEPKLKASFVTRPAYTKEGEVYKTNSVRWIGEIYVNSKLVYKTTDFDNESSAFNACANHVDWYQLKYKSSFFIDANMNRIKSS